MKRFTDTAKWDKPWFRLLPVTEKVAWFYVVDRCDNVGVWDADKEAAEFFIGKKVDWDKLRSSANGNIAVLPNGKWYLPDFCRFQYGELKESCKPHASYLALLAKHGINEGYTYPLDTLQEKEKDIEKEKEEDTLPAKSETPRVYYDFSTSLWHGISDEQVALWAEAYPAVDVELELRQMGEWCKCNGAKGKKQNWQRFVVNWLKRAQDRGGSAPVGRKR